MASPWKFLSRLVSSRRGQKQADRTGDGAKLDVVAIARPAGTLAEESLNPAGRPADVEPAPRAPSDAASAQPVQADEAEVEAFSTADSVGADVAAVGGSTSSDDPHPSANDAEELNPAVEGAARTRQSRHKKPKPAAVISQVSQGLHVASSDTMNLDEEIRVLRGQLASKLQLQNAQLKKMLERFER